MRQVLVAGCGPAGMMAAIAAAEAGAAVTVLEGMEKPGKKLLMTGSGRCNLSNMDVKLPQSYYSLEEDLAESPAGLPSQDGGDGPGMTDGAALTARDFTHLVFRQFSQKQTLDFFHSIGLLTVEKNGYVYPYTNQASSVLNLLLARLKALGVKLKFSEKILALTPSDTEEGWNVHTQTWTYRCDHLILCCGSQACSATGSDGGGYLLAGQAGHSVTPVVPALTALIGRGSIFSACAGVRCHAQVTLLATANGSERETVQSATSSQAGHEAVRSASSPQAGREIARSASSSRAEQGAAHSGAAWTVLAEDAGELQWTENGISGIVVFQVSRFAAAALACGRKVRVLLDLLPDMPERDLQSYLLHLAALHKDTSISDAFSGILPQKLLEALFGQLRLRPGMRAGDFTEVHCSNLVHAVKDFALPVTGTRDFDQCQVCAGGVRLAEVDPRTMRSRITPHLSFAGEILDIDGPCGGYNLQWAWSSGYVAGKYAAEDVLEIL